MIRGGSWRYDAVICRSAFRYWDEPSARVYDLGFRLSRTGPLHSYPFALGRAEEKPEPAPEPIPDLHDPMPDGTEGPAMVWLPSGVFTMGQDDSPYDDEKPAHPVWVDAFSIGQYPVTFEEYDRFCEATGRAKPNDGGWGRGRRPVIYVSWDDARAYCDRLGAQAGEAYRLLTEAEWEYACRAGSTTPWSFGDDETKLGDYAWHSANARGQTHPVGEKRPNAWHLYDMHGNCWEWCADWYASDAYRERLRELGAVSGDATDVTREAGTNSQVAASVSRTAAKENPSGPATGSNRVVRGGSWRYGAGYCRSAYRRGYVPGYRLYDLGFRLSRTGPWRSYPITLGAAKAEPEKPQPRKVGGVRSKPRSVEDESPLEPSSSEPPVQPQQGFRDRFVIIRRDGTEEPLDAPEMVYLPAGTFAMGDERGRDDEKPVHRVQLDAFAIGRTPVTWGHYKRFCESENAHWPEWLEEGSPYHLDSGGKKESYPEKGIRPDALDLPVVGISWEDARAYCEWLSERTGKVYRLPTEAEWEYACRAGTRTRWSFGDEEEGLATHGWYSGNADGRLRPVAQLRANPWGLYDMHGNCWEWCADRYAADCYEQGSRASQDPVTDASGHRAAASDARAGASGMRSTASSNPSVPESGSYRVFRGGSWSRDADSCRSAYRRRGEPSDRGHYLGFRLSRTL